MKGALYNKKEHVLEEKFLLRVKNGAFKLKSATFQREKGSL